MEDGEFESYHDEYGEWQNEELGSEQGIQRMVDASIRTGFQSENL